MSLFKSKEEKIAEKKEWKQRIANSPMTQVIQDILLDKYGKLDSEEIQKLRRNSISSCRLKVESAGFMFEMKNKNGECVDSWGMLFDAMDYEDLPNVGVHVLNRIMLNTLGSIPHLTVMDSGYITYNTNRPKRAW